MALQRNRILCGSFLQLRSWPMSMAHYGHFEHSIHLGLKDFHHHRLTRLIRLSSEAHHPYSLAPHLPFIPLFDRSTTWAAL